LKLGKLKDLVVFQRGFDITKAEQIDGSYPVISSSGIHSYHADFKAEGPGVVIGRKGSLGTTFFVEDNYWPHDTTLWSKSFNGNNPKFVYYFMRNLDVNAFNVGAANPTLNRNHIHDLPVRIPDPDIQNRIADMLSGYDDLIENNRRRMELLESAARHLYREWFVNFRFPGHERVKLVQSPLGKIPEGWAVKRLGDLCQVIPGYAFKSSDWQTSGVPVIKIKNLQSDNTVETDDTDFVCGEVFSRTAQKFVLRQGDFLIAMTGATAGKVGRLRTKVPMLLNQRVARLAPTAPFGAFVWCAISSDEAKERFFLLADGAAQPNMSGIQIEDVKLIVPTESLVERFSSIAEGILALTDTLYLKNANLRLTRDLLLPKLISGALDVSRLDIETG